MLTDTKVRQSKAKSKPYKLSDRDGLYLYLSTTGAKSWHYDYRRKGKRFTRTHGPYPELFLGGARDGHAESPQALAGRLGTHPEGGAEGCSDMPNLQSKGVSQIDSGARYRTIAEGLASRRVASRRSP
jgi:hypothetical protein